MQTNWMKNTWKAHWLRMHAYIQLLFVFVLPIPSVSGMLHSTKLDAKAVFWQTFHTFLNSSTHIISCIERSVVKWSRQRIWFQTNEWKFIAHASHGQVPSFEFHFDKMKITYARRTSTVRELDTCMENHYVFCFAGIRVCLCGIASGDINFLTAKCKCEANVDFNFTNIKNAIESQTHSTKHCSRRRQTGRPDVDLCWVCVGSVSASTENEMFRKHNFLRIEINCSHSIALIHCVCDSQLNWKLARLTRMRMFLSSYTWNKQAKGETEHHLSIRHVRNILDAHRKFRLK